MTVLDTEITPGIVPVRFRPVVLDLYKGIHKGIRSELFALVLEAGRLDPADDCSIAAFGEQLRSVAHLLEHHAQTEDRHIEPVVAEHIPFLAEKIADDHGSFEHRFAGFVDLADEVRATAGSRRDGVHELYLELAAFTSSYLAHQDLEERVINPMLEDAIGVDGMVQIHGAIIGTMEPQELIAGLAVMLPAMNIDDRSELLGGIKANAPAEAFAGVWSLAGSVLVPADYQAVAQRLGLG